MQNRLSDLNNHLFAEIERLGDEDLKGEELKLELSRAQGITTVAQQIISNGSLVLKAHTARQNMPGGKLPPQLTD